VNTHRLYRSRSDRAIAGIAGGMAEYLEVDPTIVRILWIFAAVFTGGLMLLLYIVLAFVIPLNPFGPAPMPGGGWAPGTTPGGWSQAAGPVGGTYDAGAAPAWSPDWSSQWEARRAARAERSGRGGLIIGTVLIVFGLVALAGVVVPGWISAAMFWPALLLGLGAALLVASVGGSRRTTSMPPVGTAPSSAAPPDAAASVETAESSLTEAERAATPPSPPVADPTAWESDATTTFPPQPGSDAR